MDGMAGFESVGRGSIHRVLENNVAGVCWIGTQLREAQKVRFLAATPSSGGAFGRLRNPTAHRRGVPSALPACHLRRPLLLPSGRWPVLSTPEHADPTTRPCCTSSRVRSRERLPSIPTLLQEWCPQKSEKGRQGTPKRGYSIRLLSRVHRARRGRDWPLLAALQGATLDCLVIAAGSVPP